MNLELDLHSRTTSDYQGPLIAPKIQAVLEEALRDDGVIDVDAAPLTISGATKSRSIRKEKDKDKHSKTSKSRWVYKVALFIEIMHFYLLYGCVCMYIYECIACEHHPLRAVRSVMSRVVSLCAPYCVSVFWVTLNWPVLGI